VPAVPRNPETPDLSAEAAESVEAAVRQLARGGAVVVVDDEDRENEGDLIMAAQHATPDKVAFFLRYTSGLLCVAITGQRADELGLDLMVRDNTESQGTAFLVSVDYGPATSTGIGAEDRSVTTMALADDSTTPDELAKPGHVLPLRARDGGVLKRAGHTEAGVDLCRLAGLRPAALLCEVVTGDRMGMMRRPALKRFAARHDLPVVTIADLVRYRRSSADLVLCAGEADIPTKAATFRAIAYQSTVDEGSTWLWCWAPSPTATRSWCGCTASA
jgi:3,4-dihydroxy 2-butanone 4-phosphate synthase/GTP cyclohydrolase II